MADKRKNGGRTFRSPGRVKGGGQCSVDDVCDRWNMRFGVAVAYTDHQIGDQDTRVLVRDREGGVGGGSNASRSKEPDYSVLGLSRDSERTAREDGAK